MEPSDPDLPWVEALKAGDDHALDTLMERHQNRIFHFILRHIPDEADARELAQETFVRAYFKITTFQPRALFSTWLFQIALNLCRDHARSRFWRQRLRTFSLAQPLPGEQKTSEVDLPDPSDSPGEAVQRQEELQAVEAAVNRLPIELRGPLLLTALDGLSHEEAGRCLGLSAKAVEVKIYRARKNLRQWLDKIKKPEGSARPPR